MSSVKKVILSCQLSSVKVEVDYKILSYKVLEVFLKDVRNRTIQLEVKFRTNTIYLEGNNTKILNDNEIEPLILR